MKVPNLTLRAIAVGAVHLDSFMGRRSLEGSGKVGSQIYVVVSVRKICCRVGREVEGSAPRIGFVRGITKCIQIDVSVNSV